MTLEYELIKADINALKWDANNPNKLTDKQFSAIKNSLKKYGFLQPIIIDQDNNILDGHHRALAYKQLGNSSIQAYQLHTKTEAERRLVRQTMNKLKGTHDKAMDAEELMRLYEANSLDLLSELIGQDKQQLTDIINEYYPDLELDNVTKQQSQQDSTTTLQLGEVVQISDTIAIACGDPTDKKIVRKLLADCDLLDAVVCTNYQPTEYTAIDILTPVSTYRPHTVVLSDSNIALQTKQPLKTLYHILPLNVHYYIQQHPNSKHYIIHIDAVVCSKIVAQLSSKQ